MPSISSFSGYTMTGKQWLVLSLSDVCLCDLQGGVDDTISLTAYVTAALVELHLEKNVSHIRTLAGLETVLHPSFLPRSVVSGSTQLELVKGSAMSHLCIQKAQREIFNLVRSS